MSANRLGASFYYVFLGPIDSQGKNLQSMRKLIVVEIMFSLIFIQMMDLYRIYKQKIKKKQEFKV